MPDNIRAQADLTGVEAPSRNKGPAADCLTTDSLEDITEIAQKLAAHGGGAASIDLAFDLVLHGIVDQARAVSGATGAAIALNRDGKMVCRATSGESAPDLGVSVEAASGLTGACIRTGTIQRCLDTESDPCVDAETCRRLGVRSMLLIPLTDVNGPFGVLQLFSSLPNAFGEQEMATLLRLADRVVENRKAVLQTAKPAVKFDRVHVLPQDQLKLKRGTEGESISEHDVFPPQIAVERRGGFWTVVLFLLVIVTAISLGIVVGWSNGRKSAAAQVPRQSNTEGTQLPTRPSAQDTAPESTSSGITSSHFHNEGDSAAAPDGGLIVTENGKVIYRSPKTPSKETSKQSLSPPRERELIHRVEPNYPAEARAQHIEGKVIIDIDIGTDGSVTNAEIISGDPRLASAAVQAVRQWQYQPDPGRASRTRVTLQFTLPIN